MKKKLFYVIVCLMLAAVFTVSAFAYVMAIDQVDVDGMGTGYLSSYTGRSYVETAANSAGDPYHDPKGDPEYNWVSAELFIDGRYIDEEKNMGSQYTTAWYSCNSSGSYVQGGHYIVRAFLQYEEYSSVNP